jgi:ABC-type uncharacterized transport system substrate-binding protein
MGCQARQPATAYPRDNLVLMIATMKRLSLGLSLIAFAASVLLYTDLDSRNSSRRQAGTSNVPDKMLRVALVQHASIPALEDGATGIIETLAERGYQHGSHLQLKRYNAEADIGTANAIAKEVTSGGYDLIVSVSTISLQTIANANKFGAKTPHVFGLVSDPYGAGVGIDAANHAIHPPYLTGYGSMAPVASIFRTAREMRPELKSVGLAWNPAEANSQAQTKLAREVCQELGIQLVEANAENSTAAMEAANSLISRGVEAIWISGDITISLASDQILRAARRARIPVFTSLPPMVEHGALFDLGADYLEVGRSVGSLAADVLDGTKNPAVVPVENFLPEIFLLNETVPDTLKDTWTITPNLRQRARYSLNATSAKVTASNATAHRSKPQPNRIYKIGLAYFAPEAGAEACMRGIFDGLREQGFEEGKNLEVRRAHAQGEILNIPAMLQNFDASDVDVILPMTTPVISGACGFVKRKPVVFTYCSDPIAAGAGQSFTNHLPTVTGIGSFPPVQDMVDVIRQSMPEAKTIGTIYNASEANSVKVIEVARGLFATAGMMLEEVTVSSSAEVFQAAQALIGRGVDAIYIQGDNTVIQGFDGVVKATRDAKLPLFVDDPDVAKRGAVACIGVGYYRSGYAVAKPLARVLLGESPARIPIENVSERAVWLDLAQAAKLGLKFPESVIAEAAQGMQPPATRSPLGDIVK